MCIRDRPRPGGLFAHDQVRAATSEKQLRSRAHGQDVFLDAIDRDPASRRKLWRQINRRRCAVDFDHVTVGGQSLDVHPAGPAAAVERDALRIPG